MTGLIPNRFLFDFEFPLHYRARVPVIDGDLSDWSDADLLPQLGELDGREEFAEVWGCWNKAGISIACRVANKQRPLRCDPAEYWRGDNFRRHPVAWAGA